MVFLNASPSKGHESPLNGWWQRKYFVFSPRKLGKWSNLTSIYFRWVLLFQAWGGSSSLSTCRFWIGFTPSAVNPGLVHCGWTKGLEYSSGCLLAKNSWCRKNILTVLTHSVKHGSWSQMWKESENKVDWINPKRYKMRMYSDLVICIHVVAMRGKA